METANVWYAVESIATVMAVLATIYGLRRSDRLRIDTRISDAEKALSDFKIEVAQKYATQLSIQTVETRVIDAISKLGDRIDNFMSGMINSNNKSE